MNRQLYYKEKITMALAVEKVEMIFGQREVMNKISVMACLFKQDEFLVESEKINGENGCVGEKDGCISQIIS